MNCGEIRERLHVMSDGERLARVSDYAVIAGHRLACAECRAAWRQLRRLRSSARALPASTVPPGIKESVMKNIAWPTRSERRATDRRERHGLVWIARLGVATAVVAVVAVALPDRGRRQIAAAEVVAAIERTNTWHLKGWRLRQGTRIPWEIWGRNEPFFYREECGDNLIFDDGRQRVETTAIDSTWRRIAVKFASTGGAMDAWRTPLSISRKMRSPNVLRETRDSLIFTGRENPNVGHGYEREIPAPKREVPGEQRLTIDRRTALLMRYEYRVYRQSKKLERMPGTERVVEQLDADYDRPLPAVATTLSLPQGVTLVDLQAAPSPGALPAENVKRHEGLSAQVTPLAMDAQGSVLARVRAWVGDQPLTSMYTMGRHDRLLMNISIDVRFNRVPGATDTAFHADGGRQYIHMDTPEIPALPDGSQLLLFAPLEPLPKGTPLPRSLTAQLTISPGVWSETGSGGSYSRWLWQHEFTWKLSLPQTTRAIRLEEFAPPESLRDNPQPLPMEANIDERRARQYRTFQNYDRALFWKRKVLAACPPSGNWAQLVRGGIAHLHRKMGDTERATALWNEIIAASKKYPKTSIRYRQGAEWELRHMRKQKPASALGRR